MERRALQKLDREHRLERARLGRLQSSSTIVAEGELPPDAAYEARIGDADRAAARDAARERVELQRIGANLNQVARALHSGAVQVPAGTLEAVERVADLLTGEGLG